MHLYHVLPGYHVPCGEVLEHHSGYGADIQGVYLDYVARLFGTVLFGLTHCIGAAMGTLAHRYAVSRRLFEYATGLDVIFQEL